MTPEEEARITGRDRGWKHAAYVDAYGPDTRPLAEIIADSRPGSYGTDTERAAFAAGFREGMDEFEQEQELDDFAEEES